MAIGQKEPAPLTLPFDRFWGWLYNHANCILRAGTPEVLLLDQEDFHWHLAVEEDGVLVVQLVRGKELIAEMVVLSNDIAYVQCDPGDGEDYVFECVVEGEATREVAYHFVLAHAYDDSEQPSRRSWTH